MVLNVCDVDGSYLVRKQQRMSEAGIYISPLSITEPPICGWEQLTAENHSDLSSKIPSIMPGKIDDT